MEENKKEIVKCSVCQKKEGRYKCPKCLILYCSLECYKGHSKECTEKLYEDNVNEEMKSRKATPEQTRQMKARLAEMTSMDTSGNIRHITNRRGKETAEERAEATEKTFGASRARQNVNRFADTTRTTGACYLYAWHLKFFK